MARPATFGENGRVRRALAALCVVALLVGDAAPVAADRWYSATPVLGIVDAGRQAVAARLPEQARNAFDLVLEENPKQPQALYGCGMLLVEQDQADEALRYFNRAAEAAPDFIESRCARAILLARRGNIQEAIQDINWCLDRERQAPRNTQRTNRRDAQLAQGRQEAALNLSSAICINML